MAFVHLHNHSDFSLLDGAAPVKKLVQKAASFGMKHLALTDHGNMFGAIPFYDACKENGINPLVGCEVYISPPSRLSREKDNKYYHMILIAKNTEGYQNLMKLVSIGYKEGFYYRPRIDDEVLQKYSSGLICTAACIAGEIPRLIIKGDYEKAKARALFYKGIFGDDFYMEIQRHGINEEEIANKGLIQLSKEINVPLIATNDVHYIEKEHWFAHDILLCIGTGKKISDENRFKFPTHEFYFKSPDEMRELFKDFPEAIDNTEKLAEKCNLEIPKPGPILPEYKVPEGYESSEDYVRHLVYSGLKKRYSEVTEEIKKRADYEMSVIFNMGGKSFAGYFLIVWDFIHYAKEHGIPVGPGRGSGAGSIVAYAMEITDIDPLKYDLLFERFLNTERVSMPDFDVDFCNEGREEVLDYVAQKYGQEKVGGICTFGTLKTKAVIKDIARVLDIPFAESNNLVKLVPDDLKITIDKAIAESKELRETIESDTVGGVKTGSPLINDKNIEARGGVYKTLFDVANVLENLNRNVSTHACGIVIGREALTSYVPLYYDTEKKKVASEYHKDLIEDRGLVKMDFLGLKTLTIIHNTEKLIRKKEPNFSIDKIADDDKKTFAMLSRGESDAVFQFESPGMQKILKDAKPSCIEDLIALNALYRPGPMQFIPNYIQGKKDPSSIKYPHEDLKELLKSTYGVIVYQEQVMKVVQIIGGFTLGKADEVRRIMGKKKADKLPKVEAEFIEGAISRGYSKETAKNIFDILIPFAGYGFNKSHAAAYSVVAYKTAYLKANYPAEFMAANLTNEMNSKDKFPIYLDLAKKGMHLEVLPPNINLSDRNFNVQDGKIYYGLLGIKQVGDVAVSNIIEEREKNGPYTDFQNFLSRVDLRIVNKGVLEALVLSGLFDSMGYNRATLMHNMEDLISFYAKKKEEESSEQSFLFADEVVFTEPTITIIDDYSREQKLEDEFKYVGTYCSGHPMENFMDIWEKATNIDLSNPESFVDKKTYVLVGIIKDLQAFEIKKPGRNQGRKIGSVILEDPKGSIKCTLWPDEYEKFKDMLEEKKVIAFKGKMNLGRDENDKPAVIVENVKETADLVVAKTKEIHIRMAKPFCENDVIEIKDYLCSHSGGCDLFLHVPTNTPQKETIIAANLNIKVSDAPSVLSELKDFSVVEKVWSE